MSKKNPEEEIEKKLYELELAMKESSNSNLPSAIEKSSGMQENAVNTSSVKLSKQDEASTVKADLFLVGGFTALLVGIFVLFSHLIVKAGQAWDFPVFGGIGTGGLVLMLLIGIGFFIYDYKNKVGWFLIICSLAALVIFIFSNIHIWLPAMSLLGFLFIFMPLVIGGGLLGRGIKMHNQIKEKQNPPDKQ